MQHVTLVKALHVFPRDQIDLGIYLSEYDSELNELLTLFFRQMREIFPEYFGIQ